MKGWRPCGPFVCQTGRPNRQQLTKRAATSRPNRNTSKVLYNGKILTQQRLSRTRFNGRRTSVNRAVIVTDNDGDNKLRVCAHTLLSSESTIENKNPQTDFCLHKRYWEIHITEQKDDWIFYNFSKFKIFTLIIYEKWWHDMAWKPWVLNSLFFHIFHFCFFICSQTKQNKRKKEKKWGGNKTKTEKKGGQVRGNQAMNRLSVYICPTRLVTGSNCASMTYSHSILSRTRNATSAQYGASGGGIARREQI